MRQNAPCEGRRDRDYVRLLASQGRRGDTLVAHISPLEAAILQLLGGSGTINPKTGLPEFWGLGGGVSSGGHGDAGDGTGGAASGNGAGGKGSRNDSKQGTAAVNAKQGGLGQGIGTGTRDNGLSQADIDKMVTGGDFSSPGFGIKRGVTGDATLGHDPYGRSLFDVLVDIGSGALKGASLGGTIGSLGGPAGTAIGTVLGAVGGGAYKGITGGSDLGSGVTRGQNAGAPEKDSAGGSDSGSNQGGLGASGGRGDSGGLPAINTAVTQNAQQANAGGGLLAPLNPVPPTTAPTSPTLPIGLLQYLAQNPGLLQGLTANTRFGTGAVAPIRYGQPYA